jgi:5-keto-L-gluconate epimerase
MPDVVHGSLALLSGSFDEKLRKAADLGYQGVELMTRDPATLDHLSIAASLIRFGLEAPQVVTGELFGVDGLGLVTSDADLAARSMQRGREVIDFAARFGALVNVGRFRGRLDWVRGEPHRWAFAVEKFRTFCDYAARRGVRVVLEPINRYEVDFLYSTQDGMRFVHDVGAPNLGLMLDVYHMNIEDASIEGSFRDAAGLVWHVHLADSNRLSCGAGHLDFGRIFDALREIGYTGYVSAEHFPLPDPDVAAERTARHIRPYLA